MSGIWIDHLVFRRGAHRFQFRVVGLVCRGVSGLGCVWEGVEGRREGGVGEGGHQGEENEVSQQEQRQNQERLRKLSSVKDNKLQ